MNEPEFYLAIITWVARVEICEGSQNVSCVWVWIIIIIIGYYWLRVHRKRKWKNKWRHVVNNTSWRTSFEQSCLGSHCQHKSDTSLILNCGIWRYPCYYNLLQSIKDLDSSTLLLENKNNMISDVQLAIFANGLGVALFLMVVLYHYVSVNNIKKLD